MACEKQKRKGLVTSILALCGFVSGVAYIVGYFIDEKVKNVNKIDAQAVKFNQSFVLGRFLFYPWAFFTFAGAFFPTLMGGLVNFIKDPNDNNNENKDSIDSKDENDDEVKPDKEEQEKIDKEDENEDDDSKSK